MVYGGIYEILAGRIIWSGVILAGTESDVSKADIDVRVLTPRFLTFDFCEQSAVPTHLNKTGF
jgi:hypothetical protein